MSAHAEIGRLDIALHGVSSDLARAAAEGLDAELRRRLGAVRVTPLARRASLDIAELALSPLTVHATIDAGALRAALAEHIALALQSELGAAAEDGA